MTLLLSGRRILIIGNCGSGKSTLAQKLAASSGLPLIHLDREYYKTDWVKPEKNEWEEKVKKLVLRPEWIMDGNYFNTMGLRLERADTIIFLDMPRLLCTRRVILRSLSRKERTRTDMAAGCRERFSPGFIAYVWNYNKIMRPRIYTLLRKYPGRNCTVLKNSKAVKDFIRSSLQELSVLPEYGTPRSGI